MRRLFLCFLLCLMPLRLWAGVWMPVESGASHHNLESANLAHQTEIGADHGCHEVMAALTHDDNAQLSSTAQTTGQKAEGHDATCQLCGVCHQSANLAVWHAMAPVFQVHQQPVGAILTPIVRTPPPLIKPPIF